MEIYKDIVIHIRKEANKYRAKADGVGEEYLDNTRESALAGVKRKIDNIENWRKMHGMINKDKED